MKTKNRLVAFPKLPLIMLLTMFIIGMAFMSFKKNNKKSHKPNIIFILSDDQGYGDLSCYGSKIIETPNIDKIAYEGMTFNSFYVQNRCSPTRAALMTGCHAQRVNMNKVIYHRDASGINSNEITIAELLKEAGYFTGIIGKWHLGDWLQFNPLNHGFDYFYGLIDENGDGRVIYENKKKVADLDSKSDRYSTTKFQPASIKFIRDHKEEPFFLYYASNIPHADWEALDSFKGSSKQGAYGDCVQQLDWVVGEMLNELEVLGLAENTIVIYASDNGPQLNKDGYGSAGVLRDGKWSNFEGGIRVPCVMRWPGKIPKNSVNNQITGIIDMLPTFCEITGVEAPTDRIIDGKSILPYMLGNKVEEPIHENFIVPGETIRHGDWKLLVSEQKPGGNIKKVGSRDRISAKKGALFNLKDDVEERYDVSSRYPEKVNELQKIMDNYMFDFKRNIRKREYVNNN